ncbi:MAG TPA: transcriptional regulator, partial [Firmicutes bacterium]|nr:transcriptional regulator [Bacillota bacterium]
MKRLYVSGLILLIVLSLASCSQNHNFVNIDDAISLAIKDQGTFYALGETSTEGHIILEAKEDNGTIKVYTIASFGAFGFENGIFTKVSGSGAIPTVIIFYQDENGEYTLLEYQ